MLHLTFLKGITANLPNTSSGTGKISKKLIYQSAFALDFFWYVREFLSYFLVLYRCFWTMMDYKRLLTYLQIWIGRRGKFKFQIVWNYFTRSMSLSIPLKTLEKQRFSDVFRGYRKRPMTLIDLKHCKCYEKSSVLVHLLIH